MSNVVLDASALLALLDQEPGVEKLTPDVMSGALISSVNLAEVQSKLVARGVGADVAWEAAIAAIREVVPFTAEQARLAGDLVAKTRRLGLSLGDRACVALALALNLPLYTADKSWKKLNVGASIHAIR